MCRALLLLGQEKGDGMSARALLTSFSIDNAEQVNLFLLVLALAHHYVALLQIVRQWWDLLFRVIGKYHDGVKVSSFFLVTTPGTMRPVSLRSWTLTKRRCCPTSCSSRVSGCNPSTGGTSRKVRLRSTWSVITVVAACFPDDDAAKEPEPVIPPYPEPIVVTAPAVAPHEQTAALPVLGSPGHVGAVHAPSSSNGWALSAALIAAAAFAAGTAFGRFYFGGRKEDGYEPL